jgi:hypothetical protein
MRQFLFWIALAIVPCLSFSQTPSHFFHHYKQYKEVHSVTLPGWLIKFGAHTSRPFAETYEEKIAIGMLGRVGKLRLLFSEEFEVTEKTKKRLHASLAEGGYESLVTVKSSDTNVNLWLKEHRKNKNRKQLVIWVTENNEFVFVHVKAKLSEKQLQDFINKLSRGNVL